MGSNEPHRARLGPAEAETGWSYPTPTWPGRTACSTCLNLRSWPSNLWRLHWTAQTTLIILLLCLCLGHSNTKFKSLQITSTSNQITCIHIAQNQYSKRHPLSLDPLCKWRKTCHAESKKNLLAGGKSRWKKPREEPQRRDLCPRMDRHAIDLTCTEQNNSIAIYNLHCRHISYSSDNICKGCGSRTTGLLLGGIHSMFEL